MKSLIGEYLGQSSVFVGKKIKGGVGWRWSRPTGEDRWWFETLYESHQLTSKQR